MINKSDRTRDQALVMIFIENYNPLTETGNKQWAYKIMIRSRIGKRPMISFPLL